MIALLYKDWCFMRRQLILPLMLLWVIAIAVFLRSTMPLGLGVSLFCSMLPYVTIANDESSQYTRLAFSQPIKRSDYVWSKYLPNLLIIFVFTLLELLLLLLSPGVVPAQLPLQLLLTIAMPALITAILLPLVFKFGAGKTRLIYMGLIMLLTLSMNVSSRTFAVVIAWLERLRSLPPLALGLGGLALLAILMLISIRLSIAFVKGKDY